MLNKRQFEDLKNDRYSFFYEEKTKTVHVLPEGATPVGIKIVKPYFIITEYDKYKELMDVSIPKKKEEAPGDSHEEHMEKAIKVLSEEGQLSAKDFDLNLVKEFLNGFGAITLPNIGRTKLFIAESGKETLEFLSLTAPEERTPANYKQFQGLEDEAIDNLVKNHLQKLGIQEGFELDEYDKEKCKDCPVIDICPSAIKARGADLDIEDKSNEGHIEQVEKITYSQKPESTRGQRPNIQLLEEFSELPKNSNLHLMHSPELIEELKDYNPYSSIKSFEEVKGTQPSVRIKPVEVTEQDLTDVLQDFGKALENNNKEKANELGYHFSYLVYQEFLKEEKNIREAANKTPNHNKVESMMDIVAPEPTGFDKTVQDRIGLIQSVLAGKAKEYAGDNPDRFINFTQGSSITGISEYHTLWGYLAKHIASIKMIIDDLEKGKVPTRAYVEEKMGDFINYGVLLEGLIYDRNNL